VQNHVRLECGRRGLNLLSRCVTVPNGQTVAEIWRFFDFWRWQPPPAWIFKMSDFRGGIGQECENASPRQSFRSYQSNRCQYMAIYIFFQYGGRPSSWTCCARVWTTHEEHVVFMVVQNLVVIGAVVSILCTMLDFAHLVWLSQMLTDLNFLHADSTVNLQQIFVENSTVSQTPSYSALWFILITIPVSNCRLFSDNNISQGSVATRLRCGEMFRYHFTANLSLSLSLKEFWKSVKIGKITEIYLRVTTEARHVGIRTDHGLFNETDSNCQYRWTVRDQLQQMFQVR